METKYIVLREGTLSEEEERALLLAGETMKQGGLVAFPTETVYGLGGDALNPESSRKIYAAKGRPSDNPLIVHICDLKDIYRIVSDFPEAARKVAESFWPGPLTMILPKSDAVPKETTGGLDTVAVRFPSHPVARKLIAYSGGYVAAPSANLSGRPSPTLAKYVAQDMDGRIDWIIDGGPVGIGLESTIVDMTVDPPQILRPGYVTAQELARVLGQVDVDITILRDDSGQAPKAPGMKYRHYAPKGDLVIVEGEPTDVASYINEQTERLSAAGFRTGVIATSERADSYRADVIKCVGSRKDEEQIAHNLFTALREFDDEGIDYMFSESFEHSGLGQAIMNRLLKAAGHKVVKVSDDQ